MIQVVDQEIFDKMSMDEQKQHLMDVIEDLPKDKLKKLYDKLGKAGLFDNTVDLETAKERLRQIIKGDEE